MNQLYVDWGARRKVPKNGASEVEVGFGLAHAPLMRAVIQRVHRADVLVLAEETESPSDGEVVGSIERGLLVYLGAGEGDGEEDVQYVAKKTLGLRIFGDDEGKMSRSVVDVGGSVLVVSQFTLFGDVRKGRRPSFSSAAPPDRANLLYERYVDELRAGGVPVETGRFRARMNVRSQVDGPVTIQVDSRRLY